MGSGSSKSRPNSGQKSSGGLKGAGQKDEDEFKPVKNWEGEVIGWVPRTDSDKLRRKQLKNPPKISYSDDEDDDWRNKKKTKKRGRNSRSRSPSRRSSFNSRHGDSDESDSGRFSDRRGSDDSDDVRYPNSLRRPSLVSNMSHRSDRSDRRAGSQRSRNSRSRASFSNYDDFDGDEDRRSRKSDRSSRRSNSRDSRDSRRRSNSRSRRGSDRQRSPREEVSYIPVKKYPASRPTLRPKPKSKFSRENNVSLLHSAFKGLGTNEKQVIEVLGSLGREQRWEVARGYRNRYRTDLIEALRDELSGLFEDLCVALVTEQPVFDVRTFQLLVQHETRHMALVGLLAHESSKDLKAVRKSYKRDYEEDMMKKIERESSGAFREIFQALYSDKREEDDGVDHVAAQKDAIDLQKAVNYRERKMFRTLLLHQISRRHWQQVREVCEAYRQMAQVELTETIHDQLGDKDSIPFIAFYEACDDAPSFFAGCLRHCFDGIGTDDACLIRLFVYRCEVDMRDIAEAYYEMFDHSLETAIKKETSGDYRKLLLRMMHSADDEEEEHEDEEEHHDEEDDRDDRRRR